MRTLGSLAVSNLQKWATIDTTKLIVTPSMIGGVWSKETAALIPERIAHFREEAKKINDKRDIKQISADAWADSEHALRVEASEAQTRANLRAAGIPDADHGFVIESHRRLFPDMWEQPTKTFPAIVGHSIKPPNTVSPPAAQGGGASTPVAPSSGAAQGGGSGRTKPSVSTGSKTTRTLSVPQVSALAEHLARNKWRYGAGLSAAALSAYGLHHLMQRQFETDVQALHGGAASAQALGGSSMNLKSASQFSFAHHEDDPTDIAVNPGAYYAKGTLQDGATGTLLGSAAGFFLRKRNAGLKGTLSSVGAGGLVGMGAGAATGYHRVDKKRQAVEQAYGASDPFMLQKLSAETYVGIMSNQNLSAAYTAGFNFALTKMAEETQEIGYALPVAGAAALGGAVGAGAGFLGRGAARAVEAKHLMPLNAAISGHNAAVAAAQVADRVGLGLNSAQGWVNKRLNGGLVEWAANNAFKNLNEHVAKGPLPHVQTTQEAAELLKKTPWIGEALAKPLNSRAVRIAGAAARYLPLAGGLLGAGLAAGAGAAGVALYNRAVRPAAPVPVRQEA